MILDSFKLHTLIFQVQYPDAFLVWDRAGAIGQRISKVWPDLKINNAQPNQVTLTAKGVNIQTGLNQSSITLRVENAFSQLAVSQLSDTFAIWSELLELDVLNRVSTRVIYSKGFPNPKESNARLLSLKLVQWPDTKVFEQPLESDQNSFELMYRFEDKNSFSFLRLKTENLSYEIDLDPTLFDETEIKKTKNNMVIDFDRGLLSSISAKKFRVDEWIKGFQHVLRRDIEKVIKE